MAFPLLLPTVRQQEDRSAAHPPTDRTARPLVDGAVDRDEDAEERSVDRVAGHLSPPGERRPCRRVPTSNAVGTTATPYLRASSGRFETSTVTTRRPSRDQRSRQLATVRAERVGELDDDLAVRACPELVEVDPLEVRAHVCRAGGRRACRPRSRRRGRWPPRGAPASRRGGRATSRDVRARPRAEIAAATRNDGADDVREARRPRVLDRAFPDPRLDELEVGEAGKAVAPAESEPDDELGGEDRVERPPVRSRNATSARVPIVAWLKRGARASMTSRSRVRIGSCRCFTSESYTKIGARAEPSTSPAACMPRVVAELEARFDVVAARLRVAAGSGGGPRVRAPARTASLVMPNDRVDDELLDAAGPQLRSSRTTQSATTTSTSRRPPSAASWSRTRPASSRVRPRS